MVKYKPESDKVLTNEEPHEDANEGGETIKIVGDERIA